MLQLPRMKSLKYPWDLSQTRYLIAVLPKNYSIFKVVVASNLAIALKYLFFIDPILLFPPCLGITVIWIQAKL